MHNICQSVALYHYLKHVKRGNIPWYLTCDDVYISPGGYWFEVLAKKAQLIGYSEAVLVEASARNKYQHTIQLITHRWAATLMVIVGQSAQTAVQLLRTIKLLYNARFLDVAREYDILLPQRQAKADNVLF